MIAVGVWFYSLKTDRYLYLLRSAKHENTWGLPGGKINDGEFLLDALQRECIEELGQWPEPLKLVPIEKFTNTDNNFEYHTFFAVLTDEFIPTLNNEHYGYTWIKSGNYPKPLHPGLWSTVKISEVMTKICTVQEQVTNHSNLSI